MNVELIRTEIASLADEVGDFDTVLTQKAKEPMAPVREIAAMRQSIQEIKNALYEMAVVAAKLDWQSGR